MKSTNPAKYSRKTMWLPAGERLTDGDKRPKTHTTRTVEDFLYPPMPKSFNPYNIVRKPVEYLRDRYLKVFRATLGNHSIALYYCCWTNQDFLDAQTVEFRGQIEEAKSQLADRGKFLVHRNLGLIRSEFGDDVPSNGSSTLARIVEKLHERGEQSLSGSGKEFKLTVEGLDRTASGPEAGAPAGGA